MKPYFPARGEHGVKFVYEAEEDVRCVAVAGTFNSWDAARHRMARRENHTWELELKLPEGRHLYKIVVNDSEWILDPLNPNVSEDGQHNSSITVTEQGDVLIRTSDITEQAPGILYERFHSLDSPEWIRRAVIYQLHISAFTEGGFIGLADKLDYLQQLGVNTLWIMPFQEVGVEKRIGSFGDPYAVRDYYSIDSRFGTSDELQAFIAKAHEYGMRVILDWVMNRGSVDHILTRSHPDYFMRNENNEVYYEVPNRDYFAGLNFENEEMRAYIIEAMTYWVTRFDFDGFRLDDSDITPMNFLAQIRQALLKVKADIALISQSYDEYHHLECCDLTYDGSLRLTIKDLAERKITRDEFVRIYHSYKYSFPKGALRMRWLEEKERSRIWAYAGEPLTKPAASILLTVEGVPSIMMGQEFNERTLDTWTSLFHEYQLDWNRFDEELYAHYKALIHLRTSHAALWEGELEFVGHSEDSVLTYIRRRGNEEFLIVVNVSEKPRGIWFEERRFADTYAGANKRLIYSSGQGGAGGSSPGTYDLFIQGWETQIFQRVHLLPES
ncbi:glycosidase [Paenibacillus mucilaginosus 3016]|uniref:Glycosidase n=3 Tax=Paenibacillus mucilaginosus TaxID=61624 RepID=H6NL43_9BACL|nr:alpha-amylase family glycosyl hydrolase [Paenibacillus mucilaginosus]AFC29750.1 glycosidase [Paenibacillus mucilaginosus 3016]AFH61936.1 alpha-amylase [Paenibacillus mucilaginosus K02]WFA18421.1 alpha-amylase [Paenibacillus mucilaginosus]